MLYRVIFDGPEYVEAESFERAIVLWRDNLIERSPQVRWYRSVQPESVELIHEEPVLRSHGADPIGTVRNVLISAEVPNELIADDLKEPVGCKPCPLLRDVKDALAVETRRADLLAKPDESK